MQRTLARLLAGVTASVLVAGCSATSPPAPAPSISRSTSTSSTSPSPAGPSTSGIAAIPAAIDATVADPNYVGLSDLKAIIVSIDGSVVAERYYLGSAEGYDDLQSVTKSVLSTLVGIAIGEGKIASVDAKVGDLLPQYRRYMDGPTAKTTLRQLLTMRAGWGDDDVPLDRNLMRSWFKNGPSYEPGSRFEYTNIGPHIVAEILARATGMSILEYGRAKLFDPLGIDTRPAYQPRITSVDYWRDRAFADAGFAWVKAPDGVNTGPFGMKLRPVDLLKLGQLFLAGGKWHGRQIVPAAWVRAATTADSPDVYGYFWWVHPVNGQDGYAAIGSGGQVILVVPARKLVVAATSRLTEVDLAGDPIFRLVDAAIVPNLR